MVRRFPPLKQPDGLITSVYGLQFWVKEADFGPDGLLKVRCLAEIRGVYERTTDTYVVGKYTVPHKAMEATAGTGRTHLPPLGK